MEARWWLHRFDAVIFVVMILIAVVGVEMSDTLIVHRKLRGDWAFDCPQCLGKQGQGYTRYAVPGSQRNEKDIDIVVTYTDPTGAIRIQKVNSKGLPASWVWKDPTDGNHDPTQNSKTWEGPTNPETIADNRDDHSNNANFTGGESSVEALSPTHPAKLSRKVLRHVRRKRRAAMLMQQDRESDTRMQTAAIQRAKGLDTTMKGRYSIWRKEYDNSKSDSTLKLMRDQIIMAKAYASIAIAKEANGLSDSLTKQTRKSLQAIGEANSDSELSPNALDQAKEMGHILSLAKDEFYDCVLVARKLRAMLQLAEVNVSEQKKAGSFLIQLAAKTVPKPLHCLPLVLTADYYLLLGENKEHQNRTKFEDSSLHHYAIFSDNVLATSVVVNSTMLHAKEPETHVFHVVTDKLNFAAMKMWFLANPPPGATIEVQNIDDFTWLNASYCPVLRQLESTRMKEYYFKAHQESTLTAGTDNLKYRNPKYLSMLNHLRFYLPEVYPKLDKILFLDDDIVVQKDLTPLWSIDLQGMVNGAVETCKESFHRFDKYLNFSNPKISQNFDPNACGWAFGMNMFDMKEWRKRDITGIYHHWQVMNEDRTLWKLGSLPPGLITFYNLTYPLDRSWHVLGLGYDPALNQTEIDNAAVVHYNGNYKPWLDLAVAKYRSYWSHHVMFDNRYLRLCNIDNFTFS